MKNRSRVLSLLALLGVLAGLARAAGPGTDYSGHYLLADAQADSEFTLDVTQTGAKAEVSFSADMKDGSGAAPDGGGQGEINAMGALKFTFTDSFGNQGTGLLSRDQAGYRLKLDVATVVETRALRFYGDMLLKKTSNKPAGD
jgi:hypothetical protein